MPPTDKTNGAVPSPASLSPEARESVLRQAASIQLKRADLAARHGYSFGGNRNLYTALGYRRDLSIDLYRDRYKRGDIAERIVEAFPRGTWGGGLTLQEDSDPKVTTEFEKAADVLFDRLKIVARLLQADILARQGRYAAILLGVAGGEPGAELPKNLGDAGLLYLRPLAEDKAAINDAKLVDDISNARFGLPEVYGVSAGKGKPAVSVHYTRIIHVAEGCLEDDIYGKPALRPIYNRLDDLDKIVGGGSEAAWRRMAPGMQIDVDPSVALSPTAEQNLKDEIEDYVHNISPVIRTRGVDIELLTAAVAAFGSNADVILKIIAGATGIPLRILVGSERGELASSQDQSNWAQRVRERRRTFAEPLIGMLVDRLIDHGVLPAPTAGYTVQWQEFDLQTPEEKADLLVKYATANKAQMEAEGSILITSDEIRETILDKDPLADEDRGTPPPTSTPLGVELEGLQTGAARTFPAHRAADLNTRRIMGLILAMWAAAAAAVDAGELEDLLAAGNRAKALAVVSQAIDRASTLHTPAVADGLHRTLVTGGELELQATRRRGSWMRGARLADAEIVHGWRHAQFEVDFDSTNPRALTWAAEESSRLITEIGPETKAAVQKMIAQGFEDGIPPRELASLIKTQVGLRSDQVTAITNLGQRMRDANPGTLIRTDGGRVKIRIPKNGASEKLIAQRQASYAKRLKSQRGRLIARTESAHASNQGVKELWLQARDRGDLPTGTQRVWIDSGDGDVRAKHRGLDGQVVGIDEPFSPPIEPGQEPHCRCTQGIATEEDIERARAKAEREGEAPAVPLQPDGTWEDLNRTDRALGQSVDRNSAVERAKVKIQIADDLARQMRAANPALFAAIGDDALRAAVGQMVNEWAATSGDSSPRALALQLLAKQKYGLNSTLGHLPKKRLADARAILAGPAGPAAGVPLPTSITGEQILGAFLDAQYAATQEWLAANGITELTLVRGAFYEGAVGSTGATGSVSLQPLSSFSTSIETASSFGETVHVVRVPASQILSTARTGIGCLAESEIVVLGDLLDGWSITKSGSETKAIITEFFERIGKFLDMPETDIAALIDTI